MEAQGGGDDEQQFDFEQPKNARPQPQLPVNATPQLVSDTFMLVLGFLEKYGWFVVLGAILAVYLWNKVKPHWVRMQRKWEEQRDAKKFDPEVAASEQEKVEVSRRRWQEIHDAKASRYQEEKLQLETQKRQERIEDWERHREGKGYKSKKNKPSDETSMAQNVLKPKKKPLRNPDYSPLSGGSSGSSYRPSRRGASGGEGG